MLTLLSTLISFLMGGLPKILDFFQDRADKKHEMAMARLQTEREAAMAAAGFASQEKIEAIKLDEIEMQTYAQEREALYSHDMKIMDKASQSVVDLNGKVRPYIAFTFVGLLVFVDVAGFFWAVKSGVEFTTAMNLVFSDDEMAIVSSIIGFYFGSRQWEKHREGK